MVSLSMKSTMVGPQVDGDNQASLSDKRRLVRAQEETVRTRQ